MITFYARHAWQAALLLSLPIAAHTTPPQTKSHIEITRIGTVQQAVPVPDGQTYAVEGIVTGVYGGLSPAGFYVQETEADSDHNPATSDAIFVQQTNPIVQVGDRVQVQGVVRRKAVRPGREQPVIDRAEVTVVSTGNMLPTFTELDKYVFTAAGLMPYINRRVELTIPLTVAELYSLRTRGEVQLAAGGKLYEPTQFIDPNDASPGGMHTTGNSNEAAVRAMHYANLDRTIIFDNGGSSSAATPPPFLDPKLHTLRIGSTITNVRGILSYERGRWHLHAVGGYANAPHFAVKRPSLPNFGQVDVRLSSFNVLNYFNGDGQGGGFPTERGARTKEGFMRQRTKIIAALTTINADIVGITELENDGNGPNSAIQDLVDGLNAVLGKGTYTFINDGGTDRQPNNTDAIHNAIIYKPAVVRPVGPALLDLAPGVYERPPLAQVFEVPGHSRTEKLAIVVNHFKSKINGTENDTDQRDGQGPSNERRRQQALALAHFIKSVVQPASARVINIGDYNANYEEDPIDVMREAGFVAVTPPNSASFVYRGQIGSLDHCIVTNNLVGFLDVQKWNINSFEPPFLQYDQAGPLTDTSPYRSSDHDPVLIGVRFMGIAESGTYAADPKRLTVYAPDGMQLNEFRLAQVLPADAQEATLEFYLLEGKPMVRMQGPPAILESQLGEFTAHLAPGSYRLTLKGQGFNLVQQVVKE